MIRKYRHVLMDRFTTHPKPIPRCRQARRHEAQPRPPLSCSQGGHSGKNKNIIPPVRCCCTLSEEDAKGANVECESASRRAAGSPRASSAARRRQAPALSCVAGQRPVPVPTPSPNGTDWTRSRARASRRDIAGAFLAGAKSENQSMSPQQFHKTNTGSIARPGPAWPRPAQGGGGGGRSTFPIWQ